MPNAHSVTFYLDENLRETAQAGQHNFIGRLARVLEQAGLSVSYRANSGAARLASALRPGYAMFHMDEPSHARALTMRRVYHYPFWQIAATTVRWDWPVAKAAFDPDTVDWPAARRFQGFWRKRLFPDLDTTRKDGFIYLPLQGRLTECRSFQSASPIDMIKATLEHDPTRDIVATFHPKETYTEGERQAVHDLATQHSRLSIRTAGMDRLLPYCDYIVAQNSTAAFNGLFFNKPLVLFARSDFHHVAHNVHALGIAAAFEAAQTQAPDHAAYLWWFWQEMAINAGRPEADDQIRAALRRADWPV